MVRRKISSLKLHCMTKAGKSHSHEQSSIFKVVASTQVPHGQRKIVYRAWIWHPSAIDKVLPAFHHYLLSGLLNSFKAVFRALRVVHYAAAWACIRPNYLSSLELVREKIEPIEVYPAVEFKANKHGSIIKADLSPNWLRSTGVIWACIDRCERTVLSGLTAVSRVEAKTRNEGTAILCSFSSSTRVHQGNIETTLHCVSWCKGLQILACDWCCAITYSFIDV